MMRIHYCSLFTFASTSRAGTFYISPSKRQKSPLKLRHNTLNYLLHTVSSMTPDHTTRLPLNPIQTASFNST